MNPYEVLEISPGASPEEIKAAYHRMAKIWHPDRYTGDAKVEAEARFRALAEAFNQIKDGGPRREEGQARVSGAVPVPAPNRTQPIQLSEGSGDKAAGSKTADDWFKDAKAAFEAKETGRALALILYSLRRLNSTPSTPGSWKRPGATPGPRSPPWKPPSSSTRKTSIP